DDIAIPFDRFRDRVMFPITDWRGRVVAFGGRAMEKDVQAKYLNSPETPLFHKGSTLYNGASARSAAHQGAIVIAVEGYIDVIAMVAAGYAATVAPLGTALTEDQLALLRRMSDAPVLCFDGDKAGRGDYRRGREGRRQRVLGSSAPEGRSFGRDSSRRGKGWRAGSRPGRPGAREISIPRSSRFATSPIVRGFRTGLPPREALI